MQAERPKAIITRRGIVVALGAVALCGGYLLAQHKEAPRIEVYDPGKHALPAAAGPLGLDDARRLSVHKLITTPGRYGTYQCHKLLDVTPSINGVVFAVCDNVRELTRYEVSLAQGWARWADSKRF